MSEENTQTDSNQGSAFGEAETPKPEEGMQSSFQPQVPEELAELIGEKKKYKTVEDALKSVPHAQTHIQTLEEKIKEYEAKLQEQKTIDELLQRIEQKGTETEQNTTVTPQVTTEDIQKLVEQTLTQKQVQAAQASNISKVDQDLKGKFGDKAKEHLVTKAGELGLSMGEMQAIAAKSPNAFYNLIGFTAEKKTPPMNTTGTFRTDVNVNNTDKPKTVMFGATSQDMINAWRAAKPQ